MAACWDDVRTSLKYNYYIGGLVYSTRRVNTTIEVLIASTASGSAIAGWTVWTNTVGGYIWAGLGGITAVAAIVKPFLNLGSKIESYSKLMSDYRAIGASIENVVFSIQHRRFLADEDRKRYSDLRERKQKADAELPERLNEKLLSVCESRVLLDRPANTLWAPKIGNHPKLRKEATT